jgi:hypothetical protein
MKSLDEIGIAHQTDKASQFSRTYAQPHDYLRHLERFFEPMRDKAIKLLEIGVGGGESIRTWLEYFQSAYVYGVDIVSNTNPWNTVGSCAHDAYIFSCGDQSKPEFWKKFVEVYGGDWNVVIDDGSHNAKDMMSTFESLWPHLKSGGIYEVEDLNYDKSAAYWMRGLAAGVIEDDGRGVDSIYFARELAILRKK